MTSLLACHGMDLQGPCCAFMYYHAIVLALVNLFYDEPQRGTVASKGDLSPRRSR